MKQQTALIVVAAGVLLVGYAWLKKKGVAGVAADVVGAAADAGAGAVMGVGDLFGVPRTNADLCASARARGDMWDMSLYCPAGTFLGSAPVEAVQKLGDLVGVPRTNETECEKAKREGRTWDASFACGAGDFLSHVFKW